MSIFFERPLQPEMGGSVFASDALHKRRSAVVEQFYLENIATNCQRPRNFHKRLRAAPTKQDPRGDS